MINTSFNVRGEPIASSPTDAFKFCMGTSLDVLVIGSFYLKKRRAEKELEDSYEELYKRD